MTSSSASSPEPAIAVLLALLDQAFDHKSWHGTNLRGSLRGVSATEAAWRPAPGRHNVWELAVHAAYWKYIVLRRLTGRKRGSFPLAGSDWFPRPEELDDKAWKDDLRLLEMCHRELREAVLGLDTAALDSKQPGSRSTALELITGIAAHDLYHAGQIQLLKKLQRRG